MFFGSNSSVPVVTMVAPASTMPAKPSISRLETSTGPPLPLMAPPRAAMLPPPEVGLLQRPHQELATVASRDGVDRNADGVVHCRVLGMAHLGGDTLVGAADKHRAAARIAAGINPGGVEIDRVAQEADSAALAALAGKDSDARAAGAEQVAGAALPGGDVRTSGASGSRELPRPSTTATPPAPERRARSRRPSCQRRGSRRGDTPCVRSARCRN